jgi:hypothetical protein
MLVDDEGGDLDEYASGLGQTCAGTKLTMWKGVWMVETPL